MGPHACNLGLMTAEDPSQKPHFHRRLAAAGKAFKDLLPALPRPGSMRTRAMLYRVYVAPPFSMLYQGPAASQTSSCNR